MDSWTMVSTPGVLAKWAAIRGSIGAIREVATTLSQLADTKIHPCSEPAVRSVGSKDTSLARPSALKLQWAFHDIADIPKGRGLVVMTPRPTSARDLSRGRNDRVGLEG
jgi:hypothetical protein